MPILLIFFPGNFAKNLFVENIKKTPPRKSPCPNSEPQPRDFDQDANNNLRNFDHNSYQYLKKSLALQFTVPYKASIRGGG